MDPTNSQFSAYRSMWDFFNEVLFGGSLKPVFLNFSRAANSLGFFAPKRWESETQTVHEISLNPAYLKIRSPRDVASTLVHEMAHLWQQENGKPGRRGYHNEEWARKMDELGLAPSSTGAPGGARVGYRMSHYIVEGGAFARAFDAMPREYLLPWTCWEPQGTGKGANKPRVSKLKYTCPACNANVWGKPALSLRCDDCDQPMVAEGLDAADDSAHRRAA
jgi:predicted SprT family Zn-dependent metalloprotease